MEQVTTIGLDLAKNVFQLHGVDAAGNVLLRKQLRRGDVLRFLPDCRRVLSAWKPVPPRIIGRESSPSWGTRFD